MGHNSGAILSEVYPLNTDTETDIDIIAIHGLDTKSPDTWTWKDRIEPDVNWLADQHMLPSKVGPTRIFTCDWPADMLQRADSIPMVLQEFARHLLAAIRIKRQTSATNRHAGEDRPILFIASCLGGVILMEALLIADSDDCVKRATRGIVFLATPFRGTAFQDIAYWATPLLKVWASLRARTVTRLLDSVKGPNFDLEERVSAFTQFCLNTPHPCDVFTFYELGKTVLLGKASLAWFFPPWLRDVFHPGQPLVDRGSATLQIVPDPLALNRPHVTMNKFKGGPDDKEYELVAGKIEDMLRKIREESLLKNADDWILKKHYTEERLKVERISGEPLAKDLCYINLTIVEQTHRDADGNADRSGQGDTSPRPSDLSLFSRLKVETPEEKLQVELPTIFDPRNGPNGLETGPRRILIRGRAGVGKTTLCKKIVHDFIHLGTWGQWFDRLLWVPLRRAKRHNLGELFRHEYFSQHTKDDDLAQALWREIDVTNGVRTLFILDGLDEISQDFSRDEDFLTHLLNQPNVIITSRPYGKLPAGLHDLDLELETIGFYPDQVKQYLDKAFTDPKRVDEVQSFLQSHWLIQGLVRIPIQLDALCFTWDEGYHSGKMPETMTAVYKAIEQRLWKKDVLRLEKEHEGMPVTDAQFGDSVEDFVKDEIYFLEGLAFTGLYNDVIDFESMHQDAVSQQFRRSGTVFLPKKTLPRLSFLRTSDPSPEYSNPSRHFLHLTFQEYFAARYFVRQWKAEKHLECLELGDRTVENIEPTTFLRRHKYSPRYDVFWRFVSGSLDIDGQAHIFFNTIEKEPLDLLGPTHQRLVMHCLSEVVSPMPTRTDLETKLSQWLRFECNFRQSAFLASEVEYPQQALETALPDTSDNVKIIILRSLATRPRIPSSIIDLAVSWLGDDKSGPLKIEVCSMLGSRQDCPSNALNAVAARLQDKVPNIKRAAVKALGSQSTLPDEIIKAMAARLEDKNSGVRRAAVEALGSQSTLPDGILKAMAARLEDKIPDVKLAAVKALGSQSTLPDEILKAMAARLEDKNSGVRDAAVKALRGQSTLPDRILRVVTARLEHKDSGVRDAAVEALRGQSNLPDEILKAMAARLENKDSGVRRAAVEALGSQSTLPDGILKTVAARLEHEDLGVRNAAVKALGSQSTLPDGILKAIAARLENKDSGVRNAAVEALGSQSTLPDGILKAVAARLRDKDWGVSRAAVDAVRGQSALPDEILKTMAAWLEHEDFDARNAAVEALGSRSTLPVQILKAIAARLGNKDWVVRRAAVKALGSQSTLPDGILKAIAARLENKDSGVRNAAVEALGSQSTLPDGILKDMAARLEDKNSGVRRAAVEALGSQSTLPDGIIKALAARLEDKAPDVKLAAVKALGSQSTLPDEILKTMAAWLEHKDLGVRWAAVEALHGQSTLPDEILKTVAARLEHKDSDVRKAAAKALGSRSILPDEILKAMAARLEHEDWGARQAAAEALGSQSTLPDEILKAVAARLEHKDWGVRDAAVKALRGQSTLPDEILKTVAARLEHKDSGVRDAAVEALRGQSALPDEILKAMAARLEHEDWGVRDTAVEALGSQSTLPDEILKAVAVRLEHEDLGVRRAAVEALGSQSAMPDEILKAAATRLEPKGLDGKRAAVTALSSSAVPDEILKAVAARLEDKDSDARQAAVEALGSQSNLPDEILKAVAARLEDKDSDVKRAAAEALGSQSNLPDEILKAVAARLEDKDSDIRRSAAKALRVQSDLPGGILKAVAAMLNSKTEGDQAEAILRGHGEFYSDLLNSEFVTSLYKVLLRRSFEEQLSWYVEDGSSYVNMPEGFRKGYVHDQRELMDAVKKARPADFPSTG